MSIASEYKIPSSVPNGNGKKWAEPLGFILPLGNACRRLEGVSRAIGLDDAIFLRSGGSSDHSRV